MSEPRFAVPVILAIVVSVAASAHFAVVRSSPAPNEQLKASPARVQIWFTQVPVPVVSQLKLLAADKTDAPIGKTAIDEKEKSLFADLPKPLPSGAYVLSWRGAGDDGHVQTGEIRFTIEPKANRD